MPNTTNGLTAAEDKQMGYSTNAITKEEREKIVVTEITDDTI